MTNNEVILENSQANMFDALMQVSVIQTKGLDPEILEIENTWVRQSNLIYLLENNLSSQDQKNKAAQELVRLHLNEKKPDNYVERGYYVTNYSQ